MTTFKTDTTDCDQALAALVLDRGTAAGKAAAAHLAGCARCQVERTRAEEVAHALGRHQVPEPAAGSQARILTAAAPLLARRAAEARVLRWRVVRAFTLALLPLPAILYANLKVLLAAHALLLRWLPASLSMYVVACLGAGVALLLALSYAAVPVLAARRPSLFALEDPDVHVPA
jgi:hypothetical protein